MTYKVHPYCEAFPDLPDDELQALAADIKANGLNDPIWRYGGKIIDGKNRIRACEIAGVKPDFREWSTRKTDPVTIDKELYEFVKSKNLKRRHLDASQRAMIAAKLLEFFEKNNRISSANLRTETINRLADELVVSPRSVETASVVVQSGSSALQQAVESREVAVSDAAKVADLPKSEQTAAVKAVQSGEEKTVAAAAGVVRKPRKRKAKPELNGRKPGDDPVEPKHLLPVDKAGNSIPDRANLVKAFRASDLFVSMEKAREIVHETCYKIANHHLPDGKEFRAEVDKHMKALFHTIESFRPAFVCTSCNGGGCQRCQKRGYTCYAK